MITTVKIVVFILALALLALAGAAFEYPLVFGRIAAALIAAAGGALAYWSARR